MLQDGCATLCGVWGFQSQSDPATPHPHRLVQLKDLLAPLCLGRPACQVLSLRIAQ